MAKIEPFPAHLQRALLYVQLLNAGNYQPSPSEVDVFATQAQPSAPSAEVMKVGGFGGSLVGQLYGLPAAGDRVVGYMRTVGWIAGKERLRLTALGQALAQGLGSSPSRLLSEPEEHGVVLRPEDPARYELLARALGRARRGMLADPYLRPEMVRYVVETTTLARLLLSSRVEKQERALIAVVLQSLLDADQEMRIEVRVSFNKRFHDRYLIHEDSSVDLIGSSMSSLDNRITALVPVSSAPASELKQLVEGFWAEAEPLEPRQPREALG